MTVEPSMPSGVAPATVARLAGGSATTVLGKFLGRGFQLLTQVFLARALGPLQFGVFTLAWTLFRLASILGTAGFDKAMTRFASGSAEAARHGGATATLSARILAWGLSTSVVVAGGLLIVAPLLAGALGAPAITSPLRILALAVPLAALLAMVAAALRVRGRALGASWIQDLCQPALALVLLPLALASTAAVGATALVVTVSFAVAALLGTAAVFRSLRTPGKDAGIAPGREASLAPSAPEVPTGRIFVYALHALSSTSFVLLLFWLDKLMVGFFLGERSVGLYQAAVQLNVAFVLIVGSISAILSPVVARLWLQGQRDQVEDLFRIGVRWCLCLSVPILVLILALPEQLLRAVFGSEYTPASAALVILGLGQFVNAATGPVGQLLMMTGGERAWFVLSGGSVVLSLVLNVLLIPPFGIAGASVATGLTLFVLFGSATQVAIRRQGIRPYDRSLWTLVVSALLASIVPVALRFGTDLGAWPMIVLGGIGTVVVFGAALWRLGFDASVPTVGRMLKARLASGGQAG